MINWNHPYNSREWLKLREKHLWKQAYCQKCETTLNLQVDHIIEHNKNLKYFLDPDNLQTLCISCHSKKTLQNQKLSCLKTRRDVVINLNFNVDENLFPNALKIKNDYVFLTSGIHFGLRIENTYFFNFTNDTINYSTIDLLCLFLTKFFIHQKWKTNKFNFTNLKHLKKSVVDRSYLQNILNFKFETQLKKKSK